VRTHHQTLATMAVVLLTGAELFGQATRPAQPDEGPPITLFAGQSRVFTAPWPVQRMAVTEPKVADVQAISPTQVLVLGRKLGTTDLILWSGSGQIWQRRVDVQADLQRLRAELSRLFPKSRLEVSQSQDVVIISGELGGAEQAHKLRQFLTSADGATGLKYTDMTRLAGSGAADPPARPVSFLDPEQFARQLRELFPDSTLEVQKSRDVVIVSGLLRRAEQAQQLRRLLEALEASAADQRMGGPLRLATAPAGEGAPPPQVRSSFKFVDMTSVAGVQQVQLRVRVAEVSRTAIRSLGINALWSGHHDNSFFGASTIGPDGGGALNPINIGPPAGALAGPTGTPFTFNSNVNVSPLVTTFFGFPRADLEFFLQALAENQYLRVLAEPTLVALSGEEASFLAGGEFPIPVVQGTTVGGGLSITIEYKEFGVRLKFRPTVLGDGTIRLHVAPEVSDLSDRGAVEIQGFRVPSIVTRRAETTLELNSGQSFSMAGLLDCTDQGRSSRVPGTGDVPVLGALFRSVRYVKGETELVVLVTASLVEPLSLASDPPLPGVLDCPPNDWELYAEGLTVGRKTASLSPYESSWLARLGFDQLEGPGAWETYEQEPARSAAPVTQPAESVDITD
jgi:Flp pilus assembly secretin CpaC